MIKYIGATFKTQLAAVNSRERFYLDPRGVDYPPVSGTPAYSKITSASNAPGSYSLTSSLTYMLSTSSAFTVDVILKPNHASGVASSILSFLGGDALTLAYSASGYYVLTDRSSHTATGGTFSTAWKRLTMVFTFGGTMYLYVNGTLANSASAASLALNQVMLQVNANANSYINHIRIFNGYAATATDIANNFQNVKNEEIYFGFNKNAVGRTRCNVTNYCYSYSVSRAKGYKPATASISLHNVAGEFSADQYATFTPASGAYNGTSAQKYLSREMRIDIEVWANSISGEFYEPVFVGNTKPGSCSRETTPQGISNITLSASDGLAKINSRIVRKSRNWSDYHLSQASGTDSLFHEIAQLATLREVYNYCGNSCFENATIGNSWTALAGTFTRGSGKVLLGSYCGTLSGTSPAFDQIILMANLSQGEIFSFSIYCYSTSSFTIRTTIYDRLGSTTNGQTDGIFTHSGKGWDIVYVTHSVASSASDRLRVLVIIPATVSNIYFDCATLKYGDNIPYIFANNTDGTSGVMAIGSEQLSTYDYIGIDADDVSYTHPWATINKGENCGDIIAQICDASIARGMYIESSGVLVMRIAATALESSLGTIASASEISSGTQYLTANKLTVSGVHVDVRDGVECVWQMTASGLQNSAESGSQWTRVLDNGETLPSVTYDGVTELECIYSQDAGSVAKGKQTS